MVSVTHYVEGYRPDKPNPRDGFHTWVSYPHRSRARRGEVIGQPCSIVPTAAWRADPSGMLRQARADWRETDRIT